MSHESGVRDEVCCAALSDFYFVLLLLFPFAVLVLGGLINWEGGFWLSFLCFCSFLLFFQ